MTFPGQVSPAGKLELHNREGLERHIASLAGKRVEIAIREPRKRGSDRQKNYYWGVLIKRIADEVGIYTEDGRQQIHSELMRHYFPTEKRGGMIEIRKSYTELDSKQREDYHEWIRVDAACGEITNAPLWLPQPNETEEYEYV